jgi:SAM-dependent methyltransferase
MNWRIKALTQLGFSITPFGEQLNYLAQRHVTRSLPMSEQELRSLAFAAAQQLSVFARYSAVPLEKGVFYQFGAGWDLAMPLVLWAMGVEHQILIDRRRLLRPAGLKHTLDQLRRVGSELQLSRRPASSAGGNFSDLSRMLREHYGIDYRAPIEAWCTGIPSDSVDFIIAFNTLEHIPATAIGPILQECRRVLKPDGLIAFKIDYQDHYSYSDSRVSVYNFLRYPDWQWKIFNPALHYQNRLRHRDYIALFRRANFDVLEENRIEPTADDLEQVGALKLAEQFQSYRRAELAVRGALVILRPDR